MTKPFPAPNNPDLSKAERDRLLKRKLVLETELAKIKSQPSGLSVAWTHFRNRDIQELTNKISVINKKLYR